ncbi:MAG TPA: efflux transporter outer membrane subunit [Caulobacteraceae bacterium]|jgi:NodT family efflux transporter outer membrane factor (OMF) lipoprotein|nr:efflux transporter outer membrane subunit [Caulobacteraceae bacterium]
MKRRPILSLLLSSLGLAGCTVGPDYHRPDVKAPPAYAEAASTARTAVDYSPADLSAWWTVFGDPVLNDLVRRALAGNPDLQTAASRVREAREQTKIAAAAELPSLNASGNAATFNSNRKPPTSAAGAVAAAGAAGGLGLPIPDHLNLYSAGFDATWEVDLFGGTRRSIEAAKANTEAAEWAGRDAQVSLLAEVANDYLTLRALQARIAVGQRELERQRGQFDLIHARREAGFVTNLDVNQQTAQVETAAARIPQLDAQARVQIHALGVLVGDLPEALADTLKPAAAPLPAPPPSLPLGLPSDLLRRRPDVRQAERRLAAANAQIGVQEANLYPKLNLLGLASFASMSASDLFSSQNLSSIGAGMLSEPIFNGGRTRAQIRAAKEEHAQALLAYQKTVMTAFRDVEDTLARFKADDERRAAQARSVTATQNSLAIAQDQYRVGLVSFINVLQSENALLNSQDQLTQSDAQVLNDLVSLYKALGGGWSDEGADERRPQRASADHRGRYTGNL